MELIDFEAVVDDIDKLELDYEEDTNNFFLDNSQQEQGTFLYFYRKFHNQAHEISDTLNHKSNNNCKLDTRDLQPEMYREIDRDHVQFDEFKGCEKTALKI